MNELEDSRTFTREMTYKEVREIYFHDDPTGFEDFKTHMEQRRNMEKVITSTETANPTESAIYQSIIANREPKNTLIEELTKWQELYNAVTFKLQEAMAQDPRPKSIEFTPTETMKRYIELQNWVRDNMDQLAGIPKEPPISRETPNT